MTLALALGLVGTAPAFDAAQFDAAATAELIARGHVVLVEEDSAGRVSMVTAGTQVAAPPDQVWALITDFASYPAWMPQIASTAVTLQPDGAIDVGFQLDFKFSVITKRLEYTSRHVLTPPSRMTWTHIEGEFADGRGQWELVPVEGGTLVFYSTWTDLASMGWIIQSLFEEQPTMDAAIQASTALTVVKAVKQKLEAP